ncbi:MAG TPA: hypothetical protein PLH36_06880, partial [Armatimonadota bacterium]|nr:hypothetical protein [Armatimonadota bacterium]
TRAATCRAHRSSSGVAAAASRGMTKALAAIASVEAIRRERRLFPRCVALWEHSISSNAFPTGRFAKRILGEGIGAAPHCCPSLAWTGKR